MSGVFHLLTHLLLNKHLHIPAFRNNISFLPEPGSYAQILQPSDSLPVLIFHQYKMLHQEYYSVTGTMPVSYTHLGQNTLPGFSGKKSSIQSCPAVFRNYGGSGIWGRNNICNFQNSLSQLLMNRRLDPVDFVKQLTHLFYRVDTRCV